MNTQSKSSTKMTVVASADLGAKFIALSGVGLVGYGIIFLVQNFTSFIELGLTPELMGGTPEEIAAFSPKLYGYISHVQVGVAGLLIALGAAVVALAWFGIRTGQRWALWIAFLTPFTALVITLPLHYVHDLDTIGHLGPIYLNVALLLVGTAISYRALK
jgi:predicted small integral membrane protein